MSPLTHPRHPSHPRLRLILLVTLAAMAGGLALAPDAGAEILWSKGGAIWAMHDDGSGARELVGVAAAPGMTALREPHPAPSGDRLAFSGETDVNAVTRTGLCGVLPYTYPCFTYHFGFNASGAYRWAAGGAVTRTTAAPSYCWNCTDGDYDVAMRDDGSLTYRFQHCEGFLDELSYACVAAIKSSTGAAYPSCDAVASVAPDPTSTTRIAYTGCTSGGNQALVVTGPNRAGERVIACDDAEQRDPAWSPAGDRLVTAEDGTEPGLWVYAASNAGASAARSGTRSSCPPARASRTRRSSVPTA